MSPAETALRAAIEEAYRAFADVPAPRGLKSSQLRDAKAIQRALTAAPLRQLNEDQIGPYSGWAMTTVGEARDYRHFLPRILALSIDSPTWLGTEPVVMADKLIRAEWRNWPDDQQRAVLGFFRAAFAFSRSRHVDDDSQASLWLAALVMLGEPLAPLFEAWRTEASFNVALQIADVIQRQGKRLHRQGEVRGPFWDEIDAGARREFAHLLLSDDTRMLLEAAAALATHEDRWLLDGALAELGRKF